MPSETTMHFTVPGRGTTFCGYPVNRRSIGKTTTTERELVRCARCMNTEDWRALDGPDGELAVKLAAGQAKPGAFSTLGEFAGWSLVYYNDFQMLSAHRRGITMTGPLRTVERQGKSETGVLWNALELAFEQGHAKPRAFTVELTVDGFDYMYEVTGPDGEKITERSGKMSGSRAEFSGSAFIKDAFDEDGWTEARKLFGGYGFNQPIEWFLRGVISVAGKEDE